MIASQFNLDQRIAELIETGPASYQAPRSTHESISIVARIAAALRSTFGGTPVARTTRIAAH